MECANCKANILSESNLAFSKVAYEMVYPNKFAGLMFDSLDCVTEFAEKHNLKKYNYISDELEELKEGAQL